MEVRRADLAGSWYPGDETQCRRAIEEFLEPGLPCPDTAGGIVGGIVPHAGWIFSGRIACNVIQCLRAGGEADTCVIFGMHLHRSNDNIIMKEGLWATPLGELEVDRNLAAQLTEEFSFDVETASRYDQDNTIEVQLPFIKYAFPEIRIVPMGLPPVPGSLKIARRTVEISRELGRKIIVVGSTDLTHYGYNYGYTPKGTGKEALKWVREVNDRRAIDLMVGMDEKRVIEESFDYHNICCPGAVAGAIASARELGAVKGKEIAYSTSYEVRPDSSFVGYSGIVFASA